MKNIEVYYTIEILSFWDREDTPELLDIPIRGKVMSGWDKSITALKEQRKRPGAFRINRIRPRDFSNLSKSQLEELALREEVDWVESQIVSQKVSEKIRREDWERYEYIFSRPIPLGNISRDEIEEYVKNVFLLKSFEEAKYRRLSHYGDKIVLAFESPENRIEKENHIYVPRELSLDFLRKVIIVGDVTPNVMDEVTKTYSKYNPKFLDLS